MFNFFFAKFDFAEWASFIAEVFVFCEDFNFLLNKLDLQIRTFRNEASSSLELADIYFLPKKILFYRYVN
jgi:hypothetical protein